MTIYFAIPALNEANYIKYTLDCIAKQNTKAIVKVVVCVNQPEEWWEISDKKEICNNNIRTIELIQFHHLKNRIQVLDYCTKGRGFTGKTFGVGQARFEIFNEIDKIARNEDIVISMDADTVFDNDYVESVINSFKKYPQALALSVPYYHQLSGNIAVDSAMLRYEIYMRNYAIHMLKINAPFAFTALGSAMVFKMSSYRKINGFKPVKSGEDFYFLQQITKVGDLIIWNEKNVFPGTRFSDRVFFGTGPAMIKGHNGNWESYPIYHYKLFTQIYNLYKQLPQLFLGNSVLDNLFLKFLNSHFGVDDFVEPLRKNYKNLPQFIRAFHTKVDGLRILQFLKKYQKECNYSDETSLIENINNFSDTTFNEFKHNVDLNSYESLLQIREFLWNYEQKLLKQKQILSIYDCDTWTNCKRKN